MAPARKPFVVPQSSAAGDTMQPGMPMPPQMGRTGAQPSMGMGGAPQGEPMQQMPGAPPSMMQPPAPNAGGPTSPLNISQMLQARMGDRSAGPQQQQPMPGGAPGGQTMPPWGDSGTRPNRVALGAPGGDMGQMGLDAGMSGMGGEMGMGAEMGAGGGGPQAGAPGAMGPTVMMRLLRTLGRI